MGSTFRLLKELGGGIMAEAFPEEFDNPDDPYNYVVWYLGPEDRSKYVFPKGDDDE